MPTGNARPTDSSLSEAPGDGEPTNPMAATPQPLYLDVGGEQAFAVYHPAVTRGSTVAVVICPPFGWEELSCHRNLRAWASHLAESGHAAVRLTYPGTGDSGGNPRDPARLDAWTEAVAAAAAFARETSGASVVVAVGLSLGGILAYRAASAGARLDGLVLWSTPDRGRELIRQLRAFHHLERAEAFGRTEVPPPAVDGELEAGGFEVSAETVTDLSALELAELPVPTQLRLGALILDRDGITTSESIDARMSSAGVRVARASGAGYGALTSHPQESQLPPEVVRRVDDWLSAARSMARADPDGEWAGTPSAAGPATSPSLRLQTTGGVVSETPVQIARRLPAPTRPLGDLSGVLVEPGEPAQDLCVVFLNSGAIRRIGPNRMWVKLARRWAAQGIPSLRLDIEGIGEAGGPVSPYGKAAYLYTPDLVAQVAEALDYLQERGVAQRFALVGMCSGAYWAFHAALDNDRVAAVWMLNPAVIVWGDEIGAERALRHASVGSLLRLRRKDTRDRLKRVVRWLSARAVRRLVPRSRANRPVSVTVQVEGVLEEFRRSGKRALMVFGEDEPLEQELVRDGHMARFDDWPEMHVEHIAVTSHTLRPTWAQQQVSAILDRALLRELSAVPAGGMGSESPPSPLNGRITPPSGP